MSTHRAVRGAPSGLEPAGFFVLRAPVLPFRTLTDWGAGLSASSASDEDLERALAADRAVLLARLRTEVLRPQFREALFCASPSLDEAVRDWLRDPTSPRSESATTILVRYLTRMAARSTPFGLFSSCGVGHLQPGATSLSFVGSSLRRHTRLDMQYLTALVEALEKDPEVRAGLLFWPSSGLYRLGDHLHYAEAEMRGEPPARSLRLVSLDSSRDLDLALQRARKGATPGEVISALLESDPGLDATSARAFVDELIDSQVLISELSPPLTGPEPIHHVIAVLRRRGLGGPIAAALERVRDVLLEMDEAGVGQGDQAYRRVAEDLQGLPAPVEIARLFQVDVSRAAAPGSTLGSDVLVELQRGVALLRRIAAPIEENDLTRFAKSFRERYEGREVPLCEALDEEVGIGFGQTSSVPSDLLEGLPFPRREATPRVPWSKRESWLARRMMELERAGARTWQLSEADLTALETKLSVTSPDAPSLIAVLSTPSAEALAAGDFLISMSSVGSGGAMVLGRFCHGDPELREAVSTYLRSEESLTPDVVFAEIVHQPEGRIGNILCRPVLRDHEIPYLARSAVDEEHQIPPHDLMVSVSGSGRVRLRSKRLGRWVEPRMTNAHNPQTISLGTYRFLCALRTERGDASPAWSWGTLGDAPHLPRVCSGRLVLSLEQWCLTSLDLEPLQKGPGIARIRALRALRARIDLPRWVAVADGDNVLPVDLDNVLSCESFLDLVKRRTRVVLTEVFPGEGQQALEGPEGRHASEIVVPFLATRPPSLPQRLPTAPTLRRTFGPGSEWLYAKIYAGHATADAILREVVSPLVAGARASGAADGWFFIRYADPHPHLRVRWHGPPHQLASELLPALHVSLEPWLDSGRVHRFEVDTYVREVERYGGDRGMPLAERIFEADSDVVLGVVERFDGLHDAGTRWRLAVAGMDRLLDALDLDLAARLELLRGVRAGFAAEHGLDTALDRELGARFRRVRGELERLLAADPPADPPGLAGGLEALAACAQRIAPIATELRTLDAAGDLGAGLLDLAASLLHMHANRMLAADHRAQELVLYDYLLRIYESREARARKAPRA